MQRFISILIALLVTLPSLTATPVLAGELTINTHILLQKDVLTVGDIFNGLNANGSHALAPAPELGQELTLSAADLDRIARTLHLDWKSTDKDVNVVVERDALLVDKDMLVAALSESDLAPKIDVGAEITLTQPANGIVVPGHEKPLLTVTNVSYDDMSQSFTATILASREGKILNKTIVAGIATEMTDVPVLTAPVERGAIIGNADVTTIRMPTKSMRLGVIDHLEDVVGMAAKRNLRASEPLEKSSLMPPVLVRRNQIVTVTYKNGPIILSTKARAMANAARGETVQLENPISKKIIEAVVTGPQQTTVHMDSSTVING